MLDEKMIAKGKKFAVTSNEIKALLAEKYGDTRQFASAAEVGCQTGWANRRVDFMVMHCWEGEGLEIEAFEVKISKSDLKRELMDPDKHAVFFDEIDKYWIVAPDFVLDDLSIIPKNWGVYKVVQGENGKLELCTARKPMALHDEQTNKRMLSRSFAASMCRAFNQQSAMKCKLYEENQKMKETIRHEVEQELANGAHVVSEWTYRELKRKEDICNQLGVENWYDGMPESRKKAFKKAQRIVGDIENADWRLREVERTLRFIRSTFKEVLKDSDGNTKDILGPAVQCLDKIDLFVVTFIEYGEDVDGRARVQGIYVSEEEAHDEMRRVADQYSKDLGMLSVEVAGDTARVGDMEECGCVLKIEKRTIERSSGKERRTAEGDKIIKFWEGIENAENQGRGQA